MRLFALLALLACGSTPTDSASTDDPAGSGDTGADTDDSGGGDTGGDDTATDSGSDTGTDSGTDTGGDTDSGTALDMDFVENGPGAGSLFFVSTLELGDNACEVNSNPYSLTMYDSITIGNVNPGPQVFDEQATASENQFVNCTYHLEGDFWCDATVTGMDLASYGLDARITWGLTMGGRFVEKAVDSHTFTQRWAADLAWTFAMDCSGGDCSQASSMAGIAFPCETTGTVEAVNYSDPSLGEVK